LEDSSRFITLTYLFFSNFFFTGILFYVSLDPNSAYYHEFFLHVNLSLPPKCSAERPFKLAMAAMSESEPKPAAVVTPAPVVAKSDSSIAHFRFDGTGRRFEQYNNSNNINQIKAFPSYGNSTFAILQRQLNVAAGTVNKHFELFA
jgi:hypothetical protein